MMPLECCCDAYKIADHTIKSDLTFYRACKEIVPVMPAVLLPYVDYWESLDKSSTVPVPSHKDITPHAFQKHLPWTIVFYIDEDDNVIIKIHGTMMAHLYGDFTGNSIDSIPLVQETKKNLDQMFKLSVRQKCPVYQEAMNLKRPEKYLSNPNFLTLPFTKGGTRVDSIVLISNAVLPPKVIKPLF